MGQGRHYLCKKCGNKWPHYIGVGFMGKHIKESRESNSTGDLDEIIKCPKCGGTEFEDQHIDFLWD